MAWRSEITRCKGPHCGARILWLKSRVGRRMCFEADPIEESDALRDPRGVYYRDEDTGRAVQWTRELFGEDVGLLYRSHWGSCPDQTLFRKDR